MIFLKKTAKTTQMLGRILLGNESRVVVQQSDGVVLTQCSAKTGKVPPKRLLVPTKGTVDKIRRKFS